MVISRLLLAILLIFLVIFADSMPPMKRGKRLKCSTATICKQWCVEAGELDVIPKCFQHRCWCTTLDSPLNNELSYTAMDSEGATSSTTSILDIFVLLLQKI